MGLGMIYAFSLVLGSATSCLAAYIAQTVIPDVLPPELPVVSEKEV